MFNIGTNGESVGNQRGNWLTQVYLEMTVKIAHVCMCVEESADDADDIAASLKPSLELNPNSTDEEKLLQSSALAYSFCSDFDLSGR